MKFFNINSAGKDPIRRGIQACKDGVYFFFTMLSPSNIKQRIADLQQMTPAEIFIGFFKMIFYIFYYFGYSITVVIR